MDILGGILEDGPCAVREMEMGSRLERRLSKVTVT